MKRLARFERLGAGWRVIVLAALPALVAASTPRYDWSSAAVGYFRGDAKSLAEAAPSRRLCVQAIRAEPPAADRPSPAQARELEGCNSEALLYGIGRALNPVAARLCAILEREEENGEDLPYFSGTGILAVVYANGQGAARNLTVATHMACGMDDASAATESRVVHLGKLATIRVSRPAFGICDDATSGVSGGQCAAHDAEVQDQARARAFASLRRGWTKARLAAFDRTYASARAYADAVHELDCYGGTGATDCSIRGAQRDLDRFLAKVEALLGHGPPPPAPPKEDRANAATDPSGWARLVADLPADERKTYLSNARDVVAARAVFEHDLLAFAGTVPGTTPHGVRVLFADL